MIFQNVNVLLLDEASNNLDIPTLTILEDYLNSFVGIVVTVSHDRYFLDNVADRILAFEEDGRLRQYEGGYTDYLEASKEQEKERKLKRNRLRTNRTEPGRIGERAGPQKLKFSYKEQREFETIDGDIQKLEEEITRLDEEIAANATNSCRLSQLMEEKEQQEALLEEKMERWVYLQELAERIAADSLGSNTAFI